MPTPLAKFIRTIFSLLSGDTPPDEEQTSDTSNESDASNGSETLQEPEPNTEDTTDKTDTEQTPETEQPSDENASDDTQTGDGTQTSGSSDEADIDIDWQWPPVKRVEAPHEGDGEQTIEISLYHRAGDDNGLTACRQAAPYVNYCFEEAWGKKYTVDVTVVQEPVPATIETFVDFREYVENEAATDTRSKDANCLLMDEGGLAGRGGEKTAVINGPSLFEGWGYDPDDRPVLFGHGENHEGVSKTIHEIGHSLGLSHDGGIVRKYNRRMVHPMRTSYDDADWYIHELHRDNRKQEPETNDSF